MNILASIGKLTEFFKETGSYSSNRLMYISWGFTILGLLSFLTVKNGVFPKIDLSLVLLYGTVVAGKAVQSFAENMQPPSPTLP